LTTFTSGFFTDLLMKFPKLGFTVFAPTDDAFLALPVELRTFPITDQKVKRTLYNVLLYHVVKRTMLLNDFKHDGRLSTQHTEGKLVRIRVIRGKAIVNNRARVVLADVRAANGVIHAIDEVLMPPT
jgi:uncharacterized surface protein with fasciclin (FAS1) repeats